METSGQYLTGQSSYDVVLFLKVSTVIAFAPYFSSSFCINCKRFVVGKAFRQRYGSDIRNSVAFINANLVFFSFGGSKALAHYGWAVLWWGSPRNKTKVLAGQGSYLQGLGEILLSGLFRWLVESIFLWFAGPVSLLGATHSSSLWSLNIGPCVSEPVSPYTSL